jgi:hypothetical protein
MTETTRKQISSPAQGQPKHAGGQSFREAFRSLLLPKAAKSVNRAIVGVLVASCRALGLHPDFQNLDRVGLESSSKKW